MFFLTVQSPLCSFVLLLYSRGRQHWPMRAHVSSLGQPAKLPRGCPFLPFSLRRTLSILLASIWVNYAVPLTPKCCRSFFFFCGACLNLLRMCSYFFLFRLSYIASFYHLFPYSFAALSLALALAPDGTGHGRSKLTI